MAPVSRYESPLAQLARLLVEAREEGLCFAAAWARAVRPDRPVIMVTHPDPPAGAVRWPTDRADRQTWRAAIEGTRDGWRRAYDLIDPTPQERALTLLAPALGAMIEERLPEVTDLRSARGFRGRSVVSSAA